MPKHTHSLLSASPLFFVTLALLLTSGVSAQKPPPAFKAMPVVTTEVRQQEILERVWYSGNVLSLRKTRLFTEGEGRVLSVVQVGDRVEKGQEIAVLDDTLLRKDLAVLKAEAQVHAADASYLNKETQRLGQLQKKNYIALSEFEKVQAERDMTQAQYVASQARISQMQEKLRRMRIIAPFKGVVSERSTSVGEWLKAGANVAVLTDTQNLEISVAVPLQFLQQLEPGMSLPVEIGNALHTATVRSIVPVADGDTQLFDLRLDISAIVGYVNQRVRVGLSLGVPRNSIVIPEDALIIRNTGISVMVMTAEKKAKRIPVTVGVSTAGGLIEIRSSELKIGDQVIVRGAERLREGMPIRTVSSKQQESSQSMPPAQKQP